MRCQEVGGAEAPIIDPNLSYPPGTQWHVAVVFNSTGGLAPGMASVSLYLNGVLAPAAVNPGDTPIQLRNLNDVNNWLGRSNWTGDENLNGSFDEFRIYDTALTAEQVAASFALGPEQVIPEPTTILLLVAGSAVCLLAIRRWKLAR